MATSAQQKFDPGSNRFDDTARSEIELRDGTDERETTMYGSSRTLRKTTPRSDREKKIGHRRVDDEGTVTYKKKPTSELMTTIQLGIGQSITSLSAKPKRDLLLQDFSLVETVFFPREGSNLTPAHHYSDFRFKTYAPIAFRYFRELFDIQPDDFLLSMCNDPLVELSNPGASGSIFYISADDEFIIKTVQHKEAEFLQKLLPGYYMNLNQNPRTLLPKFYGLYCYQCGGKNIRFTVMNNLLPSFIKMHEKYDLKGSTYKRKASKHERSKKSPTLKDLDFMDIHPEGIMLEADTYNALIKTIERDCRVLQSFKIMDYSLLMGIYNLDQAAKEKSGEFGEPGVSEDAADPSSPEDRGISRARSVKQRVAQYSTAMEAIQAHSDPLEINDDDIPAGGIPARNTKGERLLLYLGLIDILQSYRLKKRLEHAMKAAVIDGDTISVHRPGFYANRFQSFFREKVFKKITSSLKQSPSKKKPSYHVRGRSTGNTDIEGQTPDTLAEPRHRTLPRDGDQAAVGGRPDLLPANATPPRMSIDSSHEQGYSDRTWATTYSYSSSMQASTRPTLVTTSPSIPLGGDSEASALGGSDMRPPSSPAHSFSESTPTHTEFTEGTPSFTTSSASVSSDMLDSASGVHSRATLSHHLDQDDSSRGSHSTGGHAVGEAVSTTTENRSHHMTTVTHHQRESSSGSASQPGGASSLGASREPAAGESQAAASASDVQVTK